VTSGQTVARQWLVVDERTPDPPRLARSLPRGSGILFLHRSMPRGQRSKQLAQLRLIARSRGLTVLDELAGEAARVHNLRELRRAGLSRTPIVFLSPLFPTRSHPDWVPIARMRAAALLRLARGPAIALGGMNERRFRTLRPLGFSGWAGIGAWRSRLRKSRDQTPEP